MVQYSPEIFDEICQLIAGGKSLNSICKQDGFPSITAVMNWLADERRDDHADLVVKYGRAREAQADKLAEETIEIADAEPERDADGKRDPAHVNQKRLQVDARKWFASKVAPKKYGDRITHQGDANADAIKQQVDIDVGPEIAKLVGEIAAIKAASGAGET